VRQQRRLWDRRVLHHVEQVVLPQRRASLEPAACIDLLFLALAEQVQQQRDRGALARDVVLQVGIEPLVTQVDLGSQGNQDRVDVKGVQAQVVAHALQAQGNALPARSLDTGGDLGLGLGDGLAKGVLDVVRRDLIGNQVAAGIDAAQESVHLGVRNVQTPELFGALHGRRGEMSPAPDLALDQQIQAGQLGVEVLAAAEERLNHLCCLYRGRGVVPGPVRRRPRDPLGLRSRATNGRTRARSGRSGTASHDRSGRAGSSPARSAHRRPTFGPQGIHRAHA
jgi:hypothetical protein